MDYSLMLHVAQFQGNAGTWARNFGSWDMCSLTSLQLQVKSSGWSVLSRDAENQFLPLFRPTFVNALR